MNHDVKTIYRHMLSKKDNWVIQRKNKRFTLAIQEFIESVDAKCISNQPNKLYSELKETIIQ